MQHNKVVENALFNRFESGLSFRFKSFTNGRSRPKLSSVPLVYPYGISSVLIKPFSCHVMFLRCLCYYKVMYTRQYFYENVLPFYVIVFISIADMSLMIKEINALRDKTNRNYIKTDQQICVLHVKQRNLFHNGHSLVCLGQLGKPIMLVSHCLIIFPS